MKKWWKNLSYRKKIVLNLLVIAFWAFGLWARDGYPLPTTEMEFRRMERQHLLPGSEIVFLSEREDDIFTVAAGPEAGKELLIKDIWAAGIREDVVVTANLGSQKPWRLREFSRLEGGCTPVPLVYEYHIGDVGGYWVDEFRPAGGGYQYTYHYFYAMLLLDVPEEAYRAEIILTDRHGEERAGRGWDLGGGLWMLGVEEDRLYGSDWFYGDMPYVLRLFGDDGSLLLSREGILA